MTGARTSREHARALRENVSEYILNETEAPWVHYLSKVRDHLASYVDRTGEAWGGDAVCYPESESFFLSLTDENNMYSDSIDSIAGKQWQYRGTTNIDEITCPECLKHWDVIEERIKRDTK